MHHNKTCPTRQKHKERCTGDLHFWRLGLVLSIEEFREGTSLDGVDGTVVEPGSVAGDDDVVGLLRQGVISVILFTLLLRLINPVLCHCPLHLADAKKGTGPLHYGTCNQYRYLLYPPAFFIVEPIILIIVFSLLDIKLITHMPFCVCRNA